MKDGPSSVPVGWGRGKISSRKLADELFAKVGTLPKNTVAMLQQCDITTCHAQPEAGGFIPGEAIGGRYYVDGDMILAQTESPEK
jgi:hypothetical protein